MNIFLHIYLKEISVSGLTGVLLSVNISGSKRTVWLERRHGTLDALGSNSG